VGDIVLPKSTHRGFSPQQKLELGQINAGCTDCTGRANKYTTRVSSLHENFVTKIFVKNSTILLCVCSLIKSRRVVVPFSGDHLRSLCATDVFHPVGMIFPGEDRKSVSAYRKSTSDIILVLNNLLDSDQTSSSEIFLSIAACDRN
jgi:hypothetical protein